MQFKCGLTRHRRRVRVTVRACTSRSGPNSSNDGETPSTIQKSKTEEIAALLGQSKEEMEQKGSEIKKQVAAENRRKYGLALASTVISTALFFNTYLDPNSNINLMKYLTSTSTPVEVVGQNGKPTMIEFSATWCENCKYMARRVFELENEYSGRINFIVVDGEDPAIQDIVDKYGVDAIPQFSMISKSGEVQTNLVGLVPKSVLASDLDALLKEETLPFEGLSLAQLKGPGS